MIHDPCTSRTFLFISKPNSPHKCETYANCRHCINDIIKENGPEQYRVRRRREMLTLTILLTLLVLVRQSTSINLTYILKKDQDGLQPGCVAEEVERYSAIGWIYPLPADEDGLPNTTTKFIPTINNDFNCKFSKNDKCNKIWAIKNWQIDENSSKTFDLIFDRRWEDFPTIFTKSGRELKDRVEIPNVFKLGFSVRASSYVELIICEGWNPFNYPCYHVNMSQTRITLHKYSSLPKNISATTTTDRPLDSYTAYSNILSDDEWRNFIVSLDGKDVLRLVDANLNRTVIEFEDKMPLKPMYLLVRSANAALWKIHQNQFMYTTSTQISRLGPTLSLASKDLCVSLFVSTCPNCTMQFIIMKDNQRKIIKEVEPTEGSEWRLVKLKDTNILTEKLNIFVETKFKGASNQTEGFWAVDDIRICHENEVKVTFLKLKDNFNENDEAAEAISCQVVQHPKWRPKKLIYSKIEDFPTIDNASNSTSVSLSWTQEDPNNQINYFISYEANDICTSEPFNLRRIKSNGFLMTKHNEITIENLVPYTTYNITFSSMLHEKEKKLSITTLETEVPTPEELPNRVQIQVTDSTAYVSWDQIDCTSVYGHLLYAINVTNTILNTTKNLTVQTENIAQINDLEPFTLYTLRILTGRSFEDIENNTNVVGMVINFTTKAGVPPPVENLEIYSIDKNSVSLRYDLPKKPKGIPINIQIIRCNPLLFKKCKSFVTLITRCPLWPKKYCVDVNNLIPYQKHNFKINIRNDFTTIFGDTVQIEGYTMEQVPGPPWNVTYNIVDCKESLDYCHLNISWLHPYNQNGTITFFNIVLNSTSYNVTENIKEVMKISNKTYLPRYDYQVKYIPYSTHYELYVQSANSKYKSEFANTHVKTADIGDHIDQSPELITKNDRSLTFEIAPADRRLKSYTLTVVVQDFNKEKSVSEEVVKNKRVFDHLCHNFGNTWISQTLQITNKTETITVGSGRDSDRPLEGNTQYCITFIVTNKYKNSEHDVVYFEKLETPSGSGAATKTTGSNQYTHLYGLLLLLLLIPLGFLIYRYLKKRRPKPKPQQNNENVYESLPFEECEENSVSNETYDHLLHK